MASSDYAIVRADDVTDFYAGTDVPGEFRRLTDALGTEQARGDAHKIDDFREASPDAAQRRVVER